MKELIDFKEEIHKCSKCGLCQAECPIYKVTGNDCSVSRGQFIMLNGIIKNELKMSKTINHYLDLCLKCGACSKFCPSGIDVVDIITTAKYEYFKTHPIEKLKAFVIKYLIFGIFPNLISIIKPKNKSKTYDKKVLFFGGCGSKLKSDKSIIKILNSVNIEVINPNFNCCGVPFLTCGDLKSFDKSIKNYIQKLKKYNITEIVTTCASCEKSLKDYIKWANNEDKPFLENIKVKNIYEYIKENKLKLILKNPVKVTYHKPCNINNFEDIKWLLENTENLDYIQMEDFDKCCGLNGLSKFKKYKIMSNIFRRKIENIKNTKTKTVLTSCLGCETALKIYSLGRYKTFDLIDFIANHL